MKHSFLTALVLLLLVGCRTEYQVDGHSTIQTLDGKKLYLKTFQEDDLVDIDSTEVLHGNFAFNGTLDSTMMVALFVGEESLMPFVLGPEMLTIHIGDAQQYVTGSALNDTLYNFIRKKSRLDNKLAELPHKESQMIMDGIEEDIIMMRLNDEAKHLAVQQDRLVTNFISANFDNVLGPGVFMIMTSSFPYPVLTPQIDEIMTKATPYFKGNAYVKRYMEAARENMKKMGYAVEEEETVSVVTDSTSVE